MSNDFSPREIVSELDKHIVGQQDAKRAVAIALRNRWRRLQLPEGLREEVLPKNILMIGPTGVGKTEIARRMAKLIDAPFLKVEATKFTEVGYVGRDVESIARDLTEVAVGMAHDEKLAEVRERAEGLAIERIINLLVEQDMRDREAAARPRRPLARRAAELAPSEEVPGGEGPIRRPGQERARLAARRRMTRLLAQNKLE